MEPDSYPVIYQTTSKRWDIHHLIDSVELNPETILLQHAFLGCDTVSRIFGIGKGKVMDNPHLLSVCANVASVFYSSESSKDSIQKAGESLLLAIYKNKQGGLNKIRYKVFMEKLSGKNAVKPESLPPTEDSAYLHFLRVYHQVQTWLGHYLDPHLFGWKTVGGALVPQFMLKPPASAELLTYVRCGCKKDGCTNNKCSCVKHGVSCSMACGKCDGVTCSNPQTPVTEKNHR